MVSLVRCGTWLYRFLIFAFSLTLAERSNINLDIWNVYKVFDVYLNKFEIVVFHLFPIILYLVIINLHRLI